MYPVNSNTTYVGSRKEESTPHSLHSMRSWLPPNEKISNAVLWLKLYRENIQFVMGKDLHSVILRDEAQLIVANCRGIPLEHVDRNDLATSYLCGHSVKQVREIVLNDSRKHLLRLIHFPKLKASNTNSQVRGHHIKCNTNFLMTPALHQTKSAPPRKRSPHTFIKHQNSRSIVPSHMRRKNRNLSPQRKQTRFSQHPSLKPGTNTYSTAYSSNMRSLKSPERKPELSQRTNESSNRGKTPGSVNWSELASPDAHTPLVQYGNTRRPSVSLRVRSPFQPPAPGNHAYHQHPTDFNVSMPDEFEDVVSVDEDFDVGSFVICSAGETFVNSAEESNCDWEAHVGNAVDRLVAALTFPNFSTHA